MEPSFIKGEHSALTAGTQLIDDLGYSQNESVIPATGSEP
jgi:hypothetical protein